MTVRKQPPAPVRDWYRVEVRAQAQDGQPTSADVYLYDAIGGWWGVLASEFVQEIADLDVEQINLYVNSPGGDVYDGVAIMNALRRHKARVVATVDGLAASAASFIIQAADERVMARGSELMIHDAWTIAIGNPEALREAADRTDRISNSMAGLYAERAGGTREEWRAAMQAETWYTAEEAVTAGLADRTEASTSDDAKDALAAAAAAHDRSIFAHAGRAAAPAPWMPQARARASHKPPAELLVDITHTHPEGADTMSDALKAGLRKRLGISDAVTLDEDGLLAKLDEALAVPQNTLPAGAVAIDEATLTQLQADAQAGREARDAQIVAERAALVEAAVADGRIAPARREHWIAALTADPGAAEVLATLAKGTVPLTQAGFTGGVDESSDEVLYSKAWGSTTTTKEA